nr:HAD family hydrolase [Paenibacillus lutrae]
MFDFDGTLADTLPICFYAFQSVFKKFDNKDLAQEEIKAMFGPSEIGIIRENLSHADQDQAVELYYEQYSDYHNQFVKQNKEINNLIGYLKEERMKLGIVTGKASRSLEISLKALQMDHVFDVIITGDDVSIPKPHPEGINKALSQLGVPPRDAIFIGDSDADIQAGIQANVYTVGVNWLPDYTAPEFTYKPDYSVHSVSEFIDFVTQHTSK